jgi:hypothetical protein
MALCSGIKADGGRCGAPAMRGSTYCVGHDPEQVESRRRRASKGGRTAGRGRPSLELKKIQHRLEDLAEQVLDGRVARAEAAVAGQLLHYARACIRDVLAAREQEELVERMERLEEALEAQEERRVS